MHLLFPQAGTMPERVEADIRFECSGDDNAVSRAEMIAAAFEQPSPLTWWLKHENYIWTPCPELVDKLYFGARIHRIVREYLL